MKKTVKAILLLMLAVALISAMLIPAYAANTAEAAAKASALKQLRLFKGVSETDFALDRGPTRAEALVMLVRTLGKEAEA